MHLNDEKRQKTANNHVWNHKEQAVKPRFFFSLEDLK